MNNNPKVTYVGHSCYVAETENTVLVFDYYEGSMPAFDHERDIFVFSSHMHPDHFNPEIFRIFDEYDHVRYILSSDIKLKPSFCRRYGITESDREKAHFIGNEEVLESGNITVKTVRSTDRGCAFLVSTDGRNVFHAGDLNIWVFEEDDEKTASEMKNAFEKETDKLKNIHIDAAFIPVDPRLGRENQVLAADSCMERLDIQCIYPMHMFGDYSLVSDFVLHAEKCGYSGRVVIPEIMNE